MHTKLNIRHLALLVLTACATPVEPVPRSLEPPPPPPVEPREEWGGTIALWTCHGWDSGTAACTTGEFTLLRPGAAAQVIAAPLGVADPAWSPDGEAIAFSGNGHCDYPDIPEGCRPEIYRINRLGVVTRLGPQGLFSYSPAWSPDGRSIAFSARNPLSGWKLMTMSADGSNLRPIGGLSGFNPAWSPDGARIAYSAIDVHGNYALFLAPSDGRATSQVTFPSHEVAGRAGDLLPAWSPDGARIAFTRTVEHYIDGSWSCQVLSMKPDGTNLVVLTRDTFCATKPVWSPGGGLIAYQGLLPETRDHGLILMNSDGTSPRLLHQVLDDFPRVAWSSH